MEQADKMANTKKRKAQASSAKKNKAEAAEYLNVSTRAIERYTAKGLLNPEHSSKSDRSKALYSVEELDKVKAQMEQQAAAKESGALTVIPRGVVEKTPKPSQAITQVNSSLQTLADAFSSLKAPAVPIADKLSLTLAEASKLSGYSEDFLSKAIHDGTLKAAKGRTRGWNIKRADLDAFVSKL